ncbi:MAG: TonB-dependent receptor [bacterium]|nr:MAG: TonB-dependent receptor [bacterium]
MKVTRIFIFLLSLVIFPVKLILAQSNNDYGDLTGTISDVSTGNPLPGANIILMRTLMGASSDLNGNFIVNKIPAGNYNIKATMMGYKSETASVSIRSGEQTNIEFRLQETVIESPTLVVTASKKAQSFQDVPNSVSIISLKEIERRNKPYLDEILEYVPGVNMMGGDVNIRGSSGFSLGAGSRVLLLVDGIPMMPGDSGDIKWDIVPASQIERVEIVKGAGSALYGSHALGGVINIITKEAKLKPTTYFQISSGIYDKPYYPEWDWTDKMLTFSQLDVTHSRSWNRLSLVISGGRRETTGYQENGWKNNYNLLTKINYRLNQQSILTLQNNWSTGDYGEIFLWRNQTHPYQISPVSVGDWVNSSKFSFNAVFRQLLNSTFTYKLRTSYFHNNFQHHYGTNDHSKANKLGLEIQAHYMPNRIHTFTMGIEGIYDNTTSSIWGIHHAYTWAGYVQDELRLHNSLSLTLGGRIDYHYVDIGQQDNQFNPKLGLNFRPTSFTTARLSVGRGFRAPTLAEMFTNTYNSGFKVFPNPELKTEKAWSYEIGINQLISDKLIVDLALFQNDYENFIEPDNDEFFNVQFVNVPNARIRGLEITAQGSVWKRLLSFNLGYTYMDPVDLDTKETLAYRPRHLWTSGLTLTYSVFEAGIDFRYISRLEKVKVYEKDDRVPQKVWDWRISANIVGIMLSLNVNNLFQYNYTQVERNIASPRNYVLTVSREL